MSRVEHDSYKESDCLCGQGQVTKHVASTDYPFGGADVRYTLDCSHCSRTWRLQGSGTFVDRATEQAAARAGEGAMALYRQHAALASQIIDRHMQALGPMTRKAELEELHRLGFSSATYAAYTKSRREGSSPGEAAHARPGSRTLLQIAGPDRADVERLGREIEAADAAYKEAGARVVRRRVGA
ncbi:hypothetical protein [Phenylobacterium sp.]|uniref:hypothetical protein n=1 Tax=Phenylobacterium sp. TaxID=1871053 RepID=UPI003783658F